MAANPWVRLDPKWFELAVTRLTQSLLFHVNFYGGVAFVTTNYDAEFHKSLSGGLYVGGCLVVVLSGWVVEQQLLCAPDAIYIVVPFCVEYVCTPRCS